MDWNKYGGLVRTTKVSVATKKEVTTEEMFANEINKQKGLGAGSKGSWWQNGKVRPRVGIYKLIDDTNDGVEISKDKYKDFLNDIEAAFNSGSFKKELAVVSEKREAAKKKRAGTSRKLKVDLE